MNSTDTYSTLNPIRNRYRSSSQVPKFSMYNKDYIISAKNAFEQERLREEIIKQKYEYAIKSKELSKTAKNLSVIESEGIYNINTIENILGRSNNNTLPDDIHTAGNGNNNPTNNDNTGDHAETNEENSSKINKLNKSNSNPGNNNSKYQINNRSNNNNNNKSFDKQSQLIQMLKNKNFELQRIDNKKECKIHCGSSSERGVKIQNLTSIFQSNHKEGKEGREEYTAINKEYEELCTRNMRVYEDNCNFSHKNNNLRGLNQFYLSKTNMVKTENEEYKQRGKIYYEAHKEEYEMEKKMLRQRIDNGHKMNERYKDKIKAKQKEIEGITNDIIAMEDKNKDGNNEINNDVKMRNLQELNKKITYENEKIDDNRKQIEDSFIKIGERSNKINCTRNNLNKVESVGEQEKNKNTAGEELLQELKDKGSVLETDIKSNNGIIQNLEKEFNKGTRNQSEGIK